MLLHQREVTAASFLEGKIKMERKILKTVEKEGSVLGKTQLHSSVNATLQSSPVRQNDYCQYTRLISQL